MDHSEIANQASLILYDLSKKIGIKPCTELAQLLGETQLPDRNDAIFAMFNYYICVVDLPDSEETKELRRHLCGLGGQMIRNLNVTNNDLNKLETYILTGNKDQLKTLNAMMWFLNFKNLCIKMFPGIIEKETLQ